MPNMVSDKDKIILLTQKVSTISHERDELTKELQIALRERNEAVALAHRYINLAGFVVTARAKDMPSDSNFAGFLAAITDDGRFKGQFCFLSFLSQCVIFNTEQSALQFADDFFKHIYIQAHVLPKYSINIEKVSLFPLYEYMPLGAYGCEENAKRLMNLDFESVPFLDYRITK